MDDDLFDPFDDPGDLFDLSTPEGLIFGVTLGGLDDDERCACLVCECTRPQPEFGTVCAACERDRHRP